MHELVRPSQGVWGTGENGIYIRGTGEQRPNLRTGIIRNKIFDFLGKHGSKLIYFRGSREHVSPWEGLISL